MTYNANNDHRSTTRSFGSSQYSAGELQEQIISGLAAHEFPKRKALSSRYPLLKPYIIAARRAYRSFVDLTNMQIARKRSAQFLPSVVHRHQSLLMRKLGMNTDHLQRQKITNLRLAADRLNGLIILPGQVFSYWNTIGKPTRARGFVDGMLLANGIVTEGVGGGLCQMSNLLMWMFLHAPVEIVERYHHSRDVFPDSGRVIPFGSGATVLYNFVDLRVKNISDQPLQLKVWVTDDHLKGQILTTKPFPRKYHVTERNHCFVHHHAHYYRFNELWKETLIEGKVVNEERVFTNFAPVLYQVDDAYIHEHGFKVIET